MDYLKTKLISVEQIAKNHFMIPTEVIHFAEDHRDQYALTEVGDQLHINVYAGIALLEAAKASGLKRHPELYGMKLSADGTHYIHLDE